MNRHYSANKPIVFGYRLGSLPILRQDRHFDKPSTGDRRLKYSKIQRLGDFSNEKQITNTTSDIQVKEN
ncbi:hypothetical protein [Algoriphagus boritolerans]|uniref:hypothetical protein n=1 Tax=Algoriphagus boritolerans TaxID=308111 RepID=UPI000B09471B|nr:hypothetical protein [Algoriphagus boritolerans]